MAGREDLATTALFLVLATFHVKAGNVGMQFERPAEVNSAELDRLPGNRPEMVEISEIYQFNRGVYLRWVKPVLDVVIGLVALIVLSPVLLGVALFVSVRMGRPILLRQRRVGRFGNEF